jgi:hypothetical protein
MTLRVKYIQIPLGVVGVSQIIGVMQPAIKQSKQTHAWITEPPRGLPLPRTAPLTTRA